MAVSLRPGPPLRFITPSMTPALRRYIDNEASSAAVLLVASLVALLWVNSPWGESYHHLWELPVRMSLGDGVFELDLHHFVNDAAMAVFFMVVGLEVARETTAGELSDRRVMSVPAIGAVGGLTVPIVIYLIINGVFGDGGEAMQGWGIVMSTDTAFVLGVLALFGPRCPDRLRMFLLALAVVDDIGAITVMAIFYSEEIRIGPLLVMIAIVGLFVALRWVGYWKLTPYVFLTVALWFAAYACGVHPTLAGVLAGLLIPASTPQSRGRELVIFGRALIENPSADGVRLANLAANSTVSANERLQSWLHPWSAFAIIPAFGLANAGVELSAETLNAALTSTVTIGVAVSLLVGNGVGITLFAIAALRSGVGVLPGGVRYSHLFGAALLAGIGFTISLFITDLAFTDQLLRDEAKIGILVGSLVSAVVGAWVLRVMGERMPLCSPAGDTAPPQLPPLPWTAPGFPAPFPR
ncbi:Na+/H+ antiporter NhaA [Kineosporia sp. NBRC 101731]|uniref:Na+/H+ antiporter NhaA n=1 Tax=Kineosporia sp. NBRC 101731 TaxID=3032199 RepID=UPI0024A38161|nr:Na+/H+ antiporter NhaA [Kineosporia sp. NBRC 101731]GLY30092.1 Na(+)/H(+) antiporter NhaA [Kineosporia sp. NBRC 101731]